MISETHRANALMYAKARRAGWRPLADRNLEPWEQNIAKSSLKHVLANGIGINRQTEGTERSIRAIIPIVVREITKRVSEVIPKGDKETFARLMKSYDPDLHARGKTTSEIRRLGEELTPDARLKIVQLLNGMRETDKFHLSLDEERRWTQTMPDEVRKPEKTFRRQLDVQTRHDIRHAIYELQEFFAATKEQKWV